MRGVVTLTFVLVVFLSPFELFGDFAPVCFSSSRAVSMGGAYLSVCEGSDAVFYNPSRIISSHRFELAVDYTMLYSVDGLSYFSSAFSYTSGRFGGFALGWRGLYLEDVYGENHISLSWGKRIWKTVSVGGSLKGLLLSAPGYSRYNDPNFEESFIALSGDLGFSFAPFRNAVFSGVVTNVNAPRLSFISTTSEPDEWHRNIRFGLSYTIRRSLVFSLDAYTRRGDFGSLHFDIGSEMTFFDALSLRSGVSDGRLGRGLGLFSKRWAFDVALASHRYLGNRYQFSFKVMY